MPTTILILGATGKQGGAAIDALLTSPQASGLDIRFLTRNPDSAAAKKLTSRGAKAVKADLNDQASLESALTGVQRAFLLTEPLSGGAEGEEKRGKTFVDAAKKTGVEHIVFASVADADTATSVPHFKSKYNIEEYIKASGISYTFLRPVAFYDNFPVAPSFLRFLGIGAFFALAGWKPVQFVACADIGIFAAKALLEPAVDTYRNATLDLTAGEYDLEDARRAYAAAQGGRIPWFASYFPSQLVYIIPHDFKQMMLYFRNHGYQATRKDVEALRRIHPGLLSFEEWVRQSSASEKKE